MKTVQLKLEPVTGVTIPFPFCFNYKVGRSSETYDSCSDLEDAEELFWACLILKNPRLGVKSFGF